MIITPTYLRKNIFKILDQVIEFGIPVEIKRKGKILKIVPTEKTAKTKNLKNRKLFDCDPEDLIVNWENEWKP